MKIYMILGLLVLTGCASNMRVHEQDRTQPTNTKDACAILMEKSHWLPSLLQAQDTYGIEPAQVLAMMKQESSFKYNARPLASDGNGLRGTSFASSAYGFSQALELTWAEYQKKTGHTDAKRDSFADSAMFMGWFVDNAESQTGVKKNNVESMYLIYHEGAGGFQKQTHKKKKWLIDTAKRVEDRYYLYSQQLKACGAKSASGGFFRRNFM